MFDIRNYDLENILIGGFFTIIALFVAGGLLLVALFEIDNIGAREQPGVGVVSSKQYYSSSTTLLPILMGSTTIVIPDSDSARYEVCVSMQALQQSGCANVSSDYYSKLDVGAEVGVIYALGAITHAFYVRSIE